MKCRGKRQSKIKCVPKHGYGYNDECTSQDHTYGNSNKIILMFFILQ